MLLKSPDLQQVLGVHNWESYDYCMIYPRYIILFFNQLSHGFAFLGHFLLADRPSQWQYSRFRLKKEPEA